MKKELNFSLDDFGLVELPKEGSKKWFKIINEAKGFSIKNENGEIFITKFHEIDQQVLDVNKFKFVATNLGEWGGNIKVILPNMEEYIIKEGSIKYVFQYNSKFYFIESLGHMWVNEGCMYEIFFSEGLFDYRKVLDFGESAEALLVEKEEIYVLSQNNIFKLAEVDDSFTKEYILENLPIDGFYPNSLAIYQDYFLIGMRGGVGKINKFNKKDFFFLTR